MPKAAEHLSEFDFKERTNATTYKIVLNVLRGLSIFAIVFVFSGNIETIAHDVKVYDSRANTASTSKPTSASKVARSLSSAVHQRDWVGLATRQEPAVVYVSAAHPLPQAAKAEDAPTTTTVTLPLAAFAVTATSSPTTTATPAASHGGYIPDTTIPAQPGGHVFSLIARIVLSIELLLLFLSEIGFPKQIFQKHIAMLGPDYGTFWLGLFQIAMVSQIFSHQVRIVLRVAAWFMFSVGVLNCLAGCLGREVKHLRKLRSHAVAATVPKIHHIHFVEPEERLREWEGRGSSTGVDREDFAPRMEAEGYEYQTATRSTSVDPDVAAVVYTTFGKNTHRYL